MHSKRKIIIAIVVLMMIMWVVLVVNINARFPNAVVEEYSYTNPATENGVEIKPISIGIYSVDAYEEKYGQIFSDLTEQQKSKKRVIVAHVKYTNKTTEPTTCRTYQYTMYSEPSGYFNGVDLPNSSEFEITLEPKEEKEIVTMSVAGLSIIDKSDLKQLANSNFMLIYAYYPVKKQLKFDYVYEVN